MMQNLCIERLDKKYFVEKKLTFKIIHYFPHITFSSILYLLLNYKSFS